MISHDQSLLERLPLVSYMLDGQAPHASLYVSPQIDRIFGLDPRSFLEDDDAWTKCIHPDDRERLADALASLQDGAEEMTVEYRVQTGDRWVWVRDTASLQDGTICGYLVDITREKGLEDDLAMERATLDAFFARSSIGLAISDGDGRYVRINESLAHLNGGSPGDFVGRTLAETRPHIAAVVDPLRERALDGDFQVVVSHPDHPIEAVLSFFPFDVGGEHYVGRVVVDLTEQRRAQAAEEQYRHLIEQLPLVAYVNDVEPRHVARWVSPQMEELTGYTAEEFLADEALGDAIIHPDDVATIHALEQEGDVFEHEYRIVRKDGEIRWVLDRMETVRDADGIALYEQGFLVDVTDRYETAAMLRAVWDGALDAMVVVDDYGNYIDVNPAACRLLGRTHEELTTMHVDEVFGEGVFGAWRKTGVLAHEYLVTRPDGSQRLLESQATADVLPGHHLAALRDITVRRELEAEAWRAQKLETVARLAGGVAHDFNNLLTAIRGYAQLLTGRADEGSVEHHHASEIDRAAARAAELTAQLLALGRRQTLRSRPLDLNRQLEDEAAALRALLGPSTELVLELDPVLDPVRVDWQLLLQAVTNIVANAAEATAAGGRIVVRTRNESLRGHDGLADGPYVVLSVQDDGCGIDSSQLEHVFEPFFTTKEVGDGTGGLGLASAYGTVTQSGGTITVESEAGAGATFAIHLPSAAPAEGETILVVDRDRATRDLAFDLLLDTSYRVYTAASAAEAVRIAERHDGALDLLVTDLDPVRQRALLDLLRTDRPALEAVAPRRPYTPERLTAAVRSALGSPKRVSSAHRSAYGK